jgi:DNA-directed RNA polymerase subunit RPC12/RpoP
MRPGHLACPNNCPEGRFEALNAPMFVDRNGRYAGHDDTRATYVCAVCQSIAVDVAAAAREMRRNRDERVVTLTCPSCGMRMLPPEDDPLASLVECPACETRFEVEEGTPRLHGGPEDQDSDEDSDDVEWGPGQDAL